MHCLSLVAPVSLPYLPDRVQAVLESGLYNYWVKQGFANGTACDSAPSTVTVHQSFSLASLWVRNYHYNAIFKVAFIGNVCAVNSNH